MQQLLSELILTREYERLSFGKESMRQPKNIAMIKATARERLIGRYGTTIGATILFLLIQVLISDIIISVINPTNIITYVIYMFSVILVDILFGVFYSGIAYLYMNVIYAQPVRTKDIFHGFTSHPDKAILIQLPFAAAGALQTIPISILRNFYMNQRGSVVFYGLLAAALLGFAVNVIVTLFYSQGYYILQDFPDRSAFEILRTSVNLMRGNKLRLFKLYLSFIPLIIFGTLAFFIPLLWVDCYMESSLAAFYQDCIATAAQNRQN